MNSKPTFILQVALLVGIAFFNPCQTNAEENYDFSALYELDGLENHSHAEKNALPLADHNIKNESTSHLSRLNDLTDAQRPNFNNPIRELNPASATLGTDVKPQPIPISAVRGDAIE